MKLTNKSANRSLLIFLYLLSLSYTFSFQIQQPLLGIKPIPLSSFTTTTSTAPSTLLHLSNKNNNDEDGSSSDFFLLTKSDQTVLGVFGSLTAIVTFYSEFVLKSTGCGVPAGPFGIYGAVEGISYLSMVAIAGFATFKKAKTGSGLPSGPLGLLGLAEGLSFLSILTGLVVLGFQVFDYGYIPNAVPMEGGMCK